MIRRYDNGVTITTRHITIVFERVRLQQDERLKNILSANNNTLAARPPAAVPRV